jgi:hypothetical protein
MEQTPSSSLSVETLSTKQFTEMLKDLARKYDQLIELNKAVATLPPSGYFPLPNGEKFDRAAMRSYNTAFKDAIRGLVKYYTQASSKKKRRTGKPNESLRAPSLYTGELVNFLRVADFGPSYSKGPNGECIEGPPLSDFLTLAKDEGILARGMLAALLSIYTTVHHLADPNNKSVLVADDIMRQTLPNTFEALRRRSIEKPQYRKGVGGTRIPLGELSADIFYHTSYPIIGSYNLVKKKDLTPEQAQLLASPDVIEQVRAAYAVVTDTLNCIREREIREGRRKASPSRRRALEQQAQPIPNVV